MTFDDYSIIAIIYMALVREVFFFLQFRMFLLIDTNFSIRHCLMSCYLLVLHSQPPNVCPLRPPIKDGWYPKHNTVYANSVLAMWVIQPSFLKKNNSPLYSPNTKQDQRTAASSFRVCKTTGYRTAKWHEIPVTRDRRIEHNDSSFSLWRETSRSPIQEWVCKLLIVGLIKFSYHCWDNRLIGCWADIKELRQERARARV